MHYCFIHAIVLIWGIFYICHFFVLAAAVLFILTGCTPKYDTLAPMPTYEVSGRKFKTTASLEFIPSGSKQLDKAVLDNLRNAQYNDIVTGAHYRGNNNNPVRIVVPLNWHLASYKCQDGLYLESRVIVMVRLPGEHTQEGLQYPTPRYFQAFAQKKTDPEKLATVADWEETLNMAVENLFTIDEFRQALEP